MDDAVTRSGVSRGGRLVELRKESFALTAQHLRDGGPTVLTDLVEETGLSRPTVIDRVNELIDRGAAEVDGRREATSRRSGRPAVRYRFRGAAGYVAAIEISKRATHVLISDLSGSIVAARRWLVPDREPGDVSAHHGGTLDRLDAALNSIPSLVPQPGRSAGLLGAGVALPGLLDADGMMTRSTDFAEFLGVDVAARTSDFLQVPAHVSHDLAAAGVAEHRVGAARGRNSFVLATAWPPVSSVLMIDGAPYRGSKDLAGVMYRMDLSSLLPNPYAADDGSFLHDLRALGDGVSLGGDLAAACDLMAVQLAAATAATDPECILIVGPAVDAYPALVDELSTRVDRYISTDFPVQLRRSSLGPLAPVTGTLLQALDAASLRYFDNVVPPVPRVSRAEAVTDEWLRRIPLAVSAGTSPGIPPTDAVSEDLGTPTAQIVS